MHDYSRIVSLVNPICQKGEARVIWIPRDAEYVLNDSGSSVVDIPGVMCIRDESQHWWDEGPLDHDMA